MNDSPLHDPHPTRTALVLGGGGAAGNAWLIGVAAGLHAAGLDLTDADLIIGTSAGSTAAAQLTGADPAELLSATLAAPPAPRAADRTSRPAGPDLDRLARTRAVIAASSDIDDMRRRMGAALQADAASTAAASERWRAVVAARLPVTEWPRQRVRITAVDARTGEPVVFDRDSGVDLVDAVAASCAGGFAYGIHGELYIDGGYRANADNADLAAGYARVLVLSPLGGRSLTPGEWGTHLATQVAGLRAAGSVVETILPDSAARAAFGPNLMDPSTRAPIARAGYEQGRAVAARLGDFWS